METRTLKYSIRDKDGIEVLRVCLVSGRSRIYIDEEEFLTCHFVPLEIPTYPLSEFKEIESINDVIDRLDNELEREDKPFELNPELDFFVNCSNLEAWVEYDYDTRILDYKLSFPLLQKMSEAGNKRAG